MALACLSFYALGRVIIEQEVANRSCREPGAARDVGVGKHACLEAAEPLPQFDFRWRHAGEINLIDAKSSIKLTEQCQFRAPY